MLLALALGPLQAHANDWSVTGIGKVVAISDIHGAHDALVETLLAAGLVDGAGGWRGGDTHLVIVGDILDRGDDSRAAMDLLMRLEEEAPASGGAVHVVLGNHELMNLVGDLRYVARGEYRAFAGEESVAERDAAFIRHRKRVRATGQLVKRPDFDDRFPAGFFAHRSAFASDGHYGRWLLQKPLALRIDGTLFVHAGISEAVAGLGLEGVNGELRAELADYLDVYETLVARGVLEVTADFYDIPDIVRAQALDGETAALAERLLELHESMLHGPGSPLWYRGNVGCSPLIEQDRLLRTLRRFDSERVVVGHTPTLGRRIWRRLDDRVLLIDAGMLTAYYGGQGAALLIEGGQLSAVYQGDSDALPVASLSERAGLLAGPFSDPQELERALAEGKVIARSGDRLTLAWQGRQVEALFRSAGRDREFLPEAAAYRLDRLLQLGMVPAAVPRDIDGEAGSLRHLPPRLVSETRRQQEQIYIPAWCPLPDQFEAVRLFDALLRNEGRSGETLAYGIASGQVILTGHGDAFSTRTGLPRQVRDAGLTVTPRWRQRLGALDSDEARDALIDVLGKRRLRALVKRAEALAELGGG